MSIQRFQQDSTIHERFTTDLFKNEMTFVTLETHIPSGVGEDLDTLEHNL